MDQQYAIGKAANEIKILLNQQHGEPAIAALISDALNQRFDNRGLNAFGWFVKEKDFGLASQGPCERQELLFAPR